jgi:hypothetical protein
MNNVSIKYLAIIIVLIFTASTLSAQYTTDEKIEAEDLEIESISGTSWLTVGNGEGWIPHPDSGVVDTATWEGPWYPSEFVYARCGNRHWLCDDRDGIVEWCIESCADEYLEVEVDIPETGDYFVYAYVANWADSAADDDNRGCGRGDKWECCSWYISWDNLDALEKVETSPGQWNVPADYIWKVFPYEVYCKQFALDTVIINHDRSECLYGDPTGCDFDPEMFYLTAGTHTLYLKVGEEFTLLDWLYVAKVGDAPPAIEPGGAYEEPQDTTQTTAVEPEPRAQPVEFRLSQNYPNPFNATTVISYTLPWKATVRLTVFDLLGQPVVELVNEEQPAGHRSMALNAEGFSSGVYIYSLEATCAACPEGQAYLSAKRKMVYLK